MTTVLLSICIIKNRHLRLKLRERLSWLTVAEVSVPDWPFCFGSVARAHHARDPMAEEVAWLTTAGEQTEGQERVRVPLP